MNILGHEEIMDIFGGGEGGGHKKTGLFLGVVSIHLRAFS